MFVIGNLMNALATLLGMLINLWSLAIFVSALLSWIPNLDPYNPVVTAVRRIADLPMGDRIPMRGVREGPRGVQWRPGAPP